MHISPEYHILKHVCPILTVFLLLVGKEVYIAV